MRKHLSVSVSNNTGLIERQWKDTQTDRWQVPTMQFYILLGVFGPHNVGSFCTQTQTHTQYTILEQYWLCIYLRSDFVTGPALHQKYAREGERQ